MRIRLVALSAMLLAIGCALQPADPGWAGESQADSLSVPTGTIPSPRDPPGTPAPTPALGAIPDPSPWLRDYGSATPPSPTSIVPDPSPWAPAISGAVSAAQAAAADPAACSAANVPGDTTASCGDAAAPYSMGGLPAARR